MVSQSPHCCSLLLVIARCCGSVLTVHCSFLTLSHAFPAHSQAPPGLGRWRNHQSKSATHSWSTEASWCACLLQARCEMEQR